MGNGGNKIMHINRYAESQMPLHALPNINLINSLRHKRMVIRWLRSPFIRSRIMGLQFHLDKLMEPVWVDAQVRVEIGLNVNEFVIKQI
jgi:hypothetical protein